MTAHVTIPREEYGIAAGISFRRRAGGQTEPAVVLLHGIGSNAGSFDALASVLPPALDVVAWNAPGYDRSRALPVPTPSPRHYAAALTEFCDALGLDRIVLVGHSLGALFAARFAAQAPQRVMALALLSPALGYRLEAGAPLPPTLQSRIDEIRSLGPDGLAAKRAARLVYAPERKPQLVAAVDAAMRQVHADGYIQAVHALGAGDLIADAATISMPALVAVGIEDIATPPANARRAYAALTRAVAFHEITGAGHALPQENPVAVAGMIESLMEHIRA